MGKGKTKYYERIIYIILFTLFLKVCFQAIYMKQKQKASSKKVYALDTKRADLNLSQWNFGVKTTDMVEWLDVDKLPVTFNFEQISNQEYFEAEKASKIWKGVSVLWNLNEIGTTNSKQSVSILTEQMILRHKASGVTYPLTIINENGVEVINPDAKGQLRTKLIHFV